MQNNLQLKTNLENLEKAQLGQMRNNLNGHFQSMIDYNQAQRNANRQEQLNIDKYIVEKDNQDHQRMVQAQNERKRWQQNMLHNQHSNDVNLKRQIQAKEAFINKEQGKLGYLPTLGEGHNR